MKTIPLGVKWMRNRLQPFFKPISIRFWLKTVILLSDKVQKIIGLNQRFETAAAFRKWLQPTSR